MRRDGKRMPAEIKATHSGFSVVWDSEEGYLCKPFTVMGPHDTVLCNTDRLHDVYSELKYAGCPEEALNILFDFAEMIEEIDSY